MNTESDAESPRLLLLLGKEREALFHLRLPPSGWRWSIVRTVGEAAVETMAAILKPTAVLLEASVLYLEGRTILPRLKARSRDTRVIFLDIEDPWGLFMEFTTDDTNDLRVHPCTVSGLGETLMGLLEDGRHDPASLEDREFARTLGAAPGEIDILRTPVAIG